MSAPYYEGPVCYQDGWHRTVDSDAEGHEVPGERLHLEDTADGIGFRYRLATDDDVRTWHERKHQAFVTVTLEDGTPGVAVTQEQLDRIQQMLEKGEL